MIKTIAGAIAEKTGKDIEFIEGQIEIPPNPKMGDYAFPCFSLAKELKKSPAEIAQDLVGIVLDDIRIEAAGPYVNFFLDNSLVVGKTIAEVLELKDKFGNGKATGKVLVESPGPNTNKPLHLGHLRNMLLGQSIHRLLKKQGKKPKIVNVVNDRGIHICKSMLAYQKMGEGKTPKSEGVKSDHFVGDYYVKFGDYLKENPKAEEEAQEMLRSWEAGDKEVLKLWKTMNDWALAGMKETYKKLDFKIEKEYLESETYKHGKDIIEKGVSDGLFSKNEDGAAIIDLEDKKLGTKVLLRSDGTSVYITQDIYMAQQRYEDYKFDEMIYVVGNEQEYHFKVLFEVFKALDWPFGSQCKHFSYGMIELPEGKMKSREGNVVDTDDILDHMLEEAKEEVQKRYPDLAEDEINKRAELISHAAVRFFFLKHDPLKNFVFDPKESLSFEGETGPYVQYTYARISSILRKAEVGDAEYGLLVEPEDKQMAMVLNEFLGVVDKAASDLKPSAICHYLIKLCQEFNSYYSKHKIIQEDTDLQNARLHLIKAVRQVIENGLQLLDIVPLEEM